MSSYVVRAIEKKDLPQVQKLDNLSGNLVFDFIEDYFEDDDELGEYAYGIFDENKLIGYCTIGGGEEYGEGFCLSDVYVLENYRYKGIGSELITKAIELEMETESYVIYATLLDDAFFPFYEKLGFVSVNNNGLIKLSR